MAEGGGTVEATAAMQQQQQQQCAKADGSNSSAAGAGAGVMNATASTPSTAGGGSGDGDVYRFADPAHGPLLLDGLRGSRDSFCDIVLRVEGEEIPAHRIVLIAFSPYFRAMFGPHTKESAESCIAFPSLSADAVRALVDFAYTGEVVITGDNVQDLLITSNFLNVLSVQKACCDFIKANLDVFNCLDVFIFADFQGCNELRADSKLFITQHFMEVSVAPGFLEIPEDLFLELIADDYVVTGERLLIPIPSQQELKIYEAAVRYLRHRVSERAVLFPLVLQRVRVPLLADAALRAVAADGADLGHAAEARRIAAQARDLRAAAVGVGGAGAGAEISMAQWATPRLASLLRFHKSVAFAAGGEIQPILERFEDKPHEAYVYIRAVKLWIRRWDGRPIVGGLEIRYSDGAVHQHGQTDFDEVNEFHLEDEERIIRVDVASGWMIDKLTFYTNKDRVYGPYGGDGGSEWIVAPPERKCSYLAWVAGAVVDTQGSRGIVRLQFVWAYYDWESLDTSMAVPRVGGVGGAGGGGGGGATPIRINNPLPGSSYPTAPGQVGGERGREAADLAAAAGLYDGMVVEDESAGLRGLHPGHPMFGRFLQSRRENLPGPALWVRAPGMASGGGPRGGGGGAGGGPLPPSLHGHHQLRHHIPLGPFRLQMHGQGPPPAAIRIAIHQHVHPQGPAGPHAQNHIQHHPQNLQQHQNHHGFNLFLRGPNMNHNIPYYVQQPHHAAAPPAALNRLPGQRLHHHHHHHHHHHQAAPPGHMQLRIPFPPFRAQVFPPAPPPHQPGAAAAAAAAAAAQLHHAVGQALAAAMPLHVPHQQQQQQQHQHGPPNPPVGGGGGGDQEMAEQVPQDPVLGDGTGAGHAAGDDPPPPAARARSPGGVDAPAQHHPGGARPRHPTPDEVRHPSHAHGCPLTAAHSASSSQNDALVQPPCQPAATPPAELDALMRDAEPGAERPLEESRDVCSGSPVARMCSNAALLYSPSQPKTSLQQQPQQQPNAPASSPASSSQDLHTQQQPQQQQQRDASGGKERGRCLGNASAQPQRLEEEEPAEEPMCEDGDGADDGARDEAMQPAASDAEEEGFETAESAGSEPGGSGAGEGGATGEEEEGPPRDAPLPAPTLDSEGSSCDL